MRFTDVGSLEFRCFSRAFIWAKGHVAYAAKREVS